MCDRVYVSKRKHESKAKPFAAFSNMVLFALLVSALGSEQVAASTSSIPSQERMVEWTVESKKVYADPFNDVDVDVIFSDGDRSWRVPAFWHGGQTWTVRFAPPKPGEYSYRLESTDRDNPDLNGREQSVRVKPYSGTNELLKRGSFRLSANKRYFEHADGTPFFWLADTWWTGMSDRLSWEGFQRLTADRKAKGFTVVQFVAGLVPFEELCPIDPGCGNEGGAVWDSKFKQINSRYFDFMDRRVEHLIQSGIAPAVVGAWGGVLKQMGVDKMKKHWRYIVARYGAWPAFWIIGGEVFDPPPALADKYSHFITANVGDWSEIASYVREIDPYGHLIAVHQSNQNELPLQRESLTDFQLFHPAHWGWPSIGAEVTQLNLHYSRREVTKPLVVGEIGYEMLGKTHLEDFQRVAFWLAALNGAAGHSYGANGVWEAYSADKPFHRWKWSIMNWEEGMVLPGSYQVGLGAKLLQQYQWWKFVPHPEWVTPRGTTLLEPRSGVDTFHMDVIGELGIDYRDRPAATEWQRRNGEFRLPYAAGVPKEVRFVYMPYFGLRRGPTPTILGLETGVRYHVYYWEPSVGIKVDLGQVERAAPGEVIHTGGVGVPNGLWDAHPSHGVLLSDDRLSSAPGLLLTLKRTNEKDAFAAVDTKSTVSSALLLRFMDPDNYVAAVYSHEQKAMFLRERKAGVDGPAQGFVPTPDLGENIRLMAEVRGEMVAVSVFDERKTYTSPIVSVALRSAGNVGLWQLDERARQTFRNFEVRKSQVPVIRNNLQRRLYDANGRYRGELSGSQWDDYGKEKLLLLDAYQPPPVPFSGDWLLVMDATAAHQRP